MTAATLEAPAPPDAGDTTREDQHLWCCHPELTLCLLQLPVAEYGATDGQECALCRLIDEADTPCLDAPDCPRRRRDA